MKKTSKKVVRDFIKAFSCAYSITKNLSRSAEVEIDPLLLQSVIGFSSGISTMGDTCGAVNGGVAVLGKKFDDLPSYHLYLLCSEYFKRLEARLDTPDCGRVHGGKHLASNFRRAILTGKTLKCMEILAHGTEIMEDLIGMTNNSDLSFIAPDLLENTISADQYFKSEKFHCSRAVIKKIADQHSIPIDHILQAAKGFIGGIGFNGTVCGAVSGGILCLGLASGVNLSDSGYSDAMRIMMHGLIKSDEIFRDEKNFRPAALFKKCKSIYQTVEKKCGYVHCRDILELKLNTSQGLSQYKQNNNIALCRDIVSTVSDGVCEILGQRRQFL